MASSTSWCGCRGPIVGTDASPQANELGEGDGLSFGLYIIGFLIVIGGLIYGAVILHVPQHWIAVGGVILLGLAILKGVQATRQKDKVD
jgi:hypothetical protein